MMKLRIFPILALCAAATSCLSLDPIEYIDAAGVVHDQNSAEVTLNGAYNALQQSEATFMLTMNYVSDNVVLANAQAVIVPEMTAAGPSGFDPIRGGGYNFFYVTTNQVNTLIDQLPGLKDELFTGDTKKQILGEAYFIRALTYFSLARTYGGVPVVLKPSDSAHSADGIKKSSYEATLDQVLADLNKAEELINPSEVKRTRASIWSVYALKARLLLYQKKWDEAASYASKVIENTSFGLVKPLSDFFTKTATQESVFEIVHSSADVNLIYTYILPPAMGGRLDYIPNPTLAEDLNNPAIGGARKDLIAENPSSAGAWYINEYGKADGSSSLHVIRFAELYLIRAEARANMATPDIEGAIADLNVIKERAGVELLTSATAEELLLEVEKERRLELAFEGHRYSDMGRTGRAKEVFGAYDTFFENPQHWILPFPHNCILGDPDLEQNPGY